jgi:dimethylhistidine N-methyltransferase
MIARELITVPSYASEVQQGLRQSPKTLPSKLFYDAAGSAWFEEITRLPEYYPTRTELEILHRFADPITQAAGAGVKVVELGSGSATKTCTLLRAFACRQLRVEYIPVDISVAALGEARKQVRGDCPQADVRPVVADFSQGFGFLGDISGPKLVLYLGSSIGNFDPESAVEMLRGVRQELKAGDALLLGTDLVKSKRILIPAYDDAQGVTSEFNKNLLRRLNRELDGNFDLARFSHRALWNPTESRIEMHLESLGAQVVDLKMISLRLTLGSGERIHTENSYKYTRAAVETMLRRSGFSLRQSWYDQKRWFAVHLASV